MTHQQVLASRPGDTYSRVSLAKTLVEQFRIEEALPLLEGTEEYHGYALNVGINPEMPAYTPGQLDWNKDRPLRVAYLGGFYESSICHCLEPVVTSHDPVRVEVHLLHDRPDQDDTTERFRKLGKWHDVHGLDDSRFVDVLRREKIDVLVDLHGRKVGNRQAALRTGVVPHLYSYLGYPGHTGFPSLDHLGWAYRGLDVPVSQSPVEKNGYITFGSFHRSPKVTAEVQRLWARVLETVPNSRLVVAAGGPDAGSQLVKNGVPAPRLEILPRTASREEYLRRYSLIDYHLDAWPYVGGATSFDSLWMGVPVVSMTTIYEMPVLSSVGQQDWVASTDTEYLSRCLQRPGRLSARDAITGLGAVVARRLEDLFWGLPVRPQGCNCYKAPATGK